MQKAADELAGYLALFKSQFPDKENLTPFKQVQRLRQRGLIEITIPRLIQLFTEKTRRGKKCWNWKGPISPDGYGSFSFEASIIVVHRFAIGLDDESPLFALHKCDNRKCVNPRHIYAGTHTDNMRDFQERRALPPLDERTIKCIAALREIIELGRQGVNPEAICRKFFALKRTY